MLKKNLPLVQGPLSFAQIQASLPSEWIRAALSSSDVATIRRRRLPVEEAVWIVIGMALYHDLPIEAVVDRLGIALPNRSGSSVSKGAIPAARERLGVEPLEWLFEKTGWQWGHASAARDQWRGLSLYGMDGTVLAVPDSDDNRAAFGGQNASGVRSAFPAVRLVALMALRSHTIAAARFDGIKVCSEHSLAAELWAELPEDSLVILDRGLASAGIFIGIERGGRNRHWMTRASSNRSWKVIESLDEGDDLVEITVHPTARYGARKQGDDLPQAYVARAIRYQIGDAAPSTILTSLTDEKKFPKEELIELYHERWEIEIGYGEIKVELLESGKPLRSKTAEGVRQELWGILLAYNLVRTQMERIGDALAVPPTRISFAGALSAIQTLLVVGAPWYSPGRVPEYLRNLASDVKRLVLPQRRRHRRYPREVKGYRERYPHKRPQRARAAK